MRAVVVARRAVAAVLLLGALFALAGSVAVRTGRVRVSRVLTGSMLPVVRPGSVVVSRPVPVEEIAVGQVVMFVPPAPFDTGGTPVAHRVVGVERRDGHVLLRTKGDANHARDPWTIDASASTVQRVAWASYGAGVVAAWTTRLGGSALLSVVVGLVALRVLALIWRPRRGRHAHRGGIEWLRDAAA